jgi:deazaflavin-dependent oxidoreductase (nitroreductase family)
VPSRLGNFFIKTIVTSPLHALLGDSFAVITVEGRKSGRHYTTPINVKRQGNAWLAVSMRDRTWWRNLRDGRPASMQVAGRRMTVHGEIVERHAEVVAGLKEYFRQYPGYAKYFHIHLGPDGKLNQAELGQAADERVLIRLISS